MNVQNEKRAQLLGMPWGTAQNKLRKMVMFQLLRRHGEDVCYRCNEKIGSVAELSIEHKEPWQSSADPVALFWDLANIAFSHRMCNTAHTNLVKDKCPQGHEYKGDNLYISRGQRYCKECSRIFNRKRRKDSGRAERQRKYNREYAKRKALVAQVGRVPPS